MPRDIGQQRAWPAPPLPFQAPPSHLILANVALYVSVPTYFCASAVSASLRLSVSATPRLHVSASPCLRVSASQRLSVSASSRPPYLRVLRVLMFCQRSEQCGGQEEKKREENKTKQNKTKQNKTKQNKTKQNKTKQNKTRKDKTRQDKTRQNNTRGIEVVWWCREWYHSCSHTANECPSIVRTIRTKFFQQVSFLSFSSPLKSAKACKWCKWN